MHAIHIPMRGYAVAASQQYSRVRYRLFLLVELCRYQVTSEREYYGHKANER
jgi:hypothetical protein